MPRCPPPPSTRSAPSRCGPRSPRSASRSRHVPPFLLTGLALVIGSLPACRSAARRAVAGAAATLRSASTACSASTSCSSSRCATRRRSRPTWSTTCGRCFIVVLAPLLLPGVRLRPAACRGAALLGFAGAALAILGARDGGARRRCALGLGLRAGAGLGLHLGQLLAADAARAGLSDRGDRPVRPGLGPAGAGLPCAAGAAAALVGARLGC